MPLTESMRRHNLEVLNRAIAAKRGSSVPGEDVAIVLLEFLAESILQWMKDKTYTYKDQTYNLSDSVGCALYNKGVLVRMYLPDKQASGPAKFTYHKVRYQQSGRQSLEAAINNRSIAMLGDYTLGVYAAMPYGLWVDQSLGDGGDNKRGKGWFSGPDGLERFAYNEFERLKNEYFRRK